MESGLVEERPAEEWKWEEKVVDRFSSLSPSVVDLLAK